jgi:hypothetical protein
VLDANYRSNQTYSKDIFTSIFPVFYTYNQIMNCVESGSYFFNYIIKEKNINDFPLFNYSKNIGTFILSNNIKINAIIPNSIELVAIFNNKIILDSYDPIIQSGTTTYNLTNWSFSNSCSWCCVPAGNDSSNLYANSLEQNGRFTGQNYLGRRGRENCGCIPIFEVPVM